MIRRKYNFKDREKFIKQDLYFIALTTLVQNFSFLELKMKEL